MYRKDKRSKGFRMLPIVRALYISCSRKLVSVDNYAKLVRPESAYPSASCLRPVATRRPTVAIHGHLKTNRHPLRGSVFNDRNLHGYSAVAIITEDYLDPRSARPALFCKVLVWVAVWILAILRPYAAHKIKSAAYPLGARHSSR